MIALDVLRVDSLLSYLIAILAPALDAILPVIPSETAVITLGVATAGSADPRIALLVLCAAFGAFLGDNLCYLLGRWFGPWIERRFFQSEKGQKRRNWAERSLERYGMPLIIVCRFIPGGRTAVMLCCGIVRYDRRRFVIATAAAGLIWASYSFFIGRLGGKAFENKPWAGLLLALGLTLTVSVIIEAVRRIRSRRAEIRRSAESGQTAEGTLGTESGRSGGSTLGTEDTLRAESTESTESTEDTRGTESTESDRGTQSAENTQGTESTESDRGTQSAENTQGTLRAESDRDARGTRGQAALDGRRARRHEPTGAGTAPSSEPSGPH
jgi:membrane protein DedA with SNARE-associated domain